MEAVSVVLLLVLALEHAWFLILESFLWTKPMGMKLFRLSPEQAQMTARLAVNQGLYNGFLAAGLVWGAWGVDAELAWPVRMFFVGCVAIAGIVGGKTVSPRIFYVQGVPAIVTLTWLLMVDLW